MVLSVPVSGDTVAKLQAKATAAGIELEVYAARQLARVVQTPDSLEAISGPVAEAFAASGMTEEQLAEFLEKEKHEMRAERRNRKSA
jgi:hypothetical protein